MLLKLQVQFLKVVQSSGIMRVAYNFKLKRKIVKNKRPLVWMPFKCKTF